MNAPAEPPVVHPDLERLLRNAARDPASRHAVRTLRWAARNQQPMVTDGILVTWLQLWEQGMRPSLLTAGVTEQHNLNQLARATLRLAGHITGPDLQLRAALHVAVGDQLVVASSDAAGPAERWHDGTLLHVTNVDGGGRSCTVDVPILGQQQDLTAADPRVRGITHAYATTRAAEHERNPPGAARQPARGLSW